MQRKWGEPVCFLVQKCLPSSVTFLQFVLTPSSSLPKTLICSSFPNTLVSGVGRLMFEGLRLHCPLPTELSLLYWLCPLPRSNSWCNRNDFFIGWLFPTFIEVFFFFSLLKKLGGKIRGKVQLFYHIAAEHPSFIYFFCKVKYSFFKKIDATPMNSVLHWSINIWGNLSMCQKNIAWVVCLQDSDLKNPC